MYAIIKVDITEHNDDREPHMADISNQSDCIIKSPHSEMKGTQFARKKNLS